MCITLDWRFPPTFHVLHAEIKFNWETHIYRGLSCRSRNTTTKKKAWLFIKQKHLFRASERELMVAKSDFDSSCHRDPSLEHQIKRSPHSACLSNGFHQLAITKERCSRGRWLWRLRQFTRWAQIEPKNSSGDDIKLSRMLMTFQWIRYDMT